MAGVNEPQLATVVEFEDLEVHIGVSDGYAVTQNGYVPESEEKKIRVAGFKGTPIQDGEHSTCCKELQQKAGEELDGQLVFPYRSGRDVAVLRVKQKGKWIAFRAPNLLTKVTAGGLIHFLHHLDEQSVGGELVIPGELPELRDEHGERVGAFNQRLFAAYRVIAGKPLRIYAWKEMDLAEVEAPHNSTELLTAQQLVVSCHTIIWYTLPADVDGALAFLSTAGRFCSKVLMGIVEPDMLDKVVQSYANYDGDMNYAVQKVDFGVFHGSAWPASLPQKDAQVAVKEEWAKAARLTMEHSRRDYAYTLKNTASGRNIRVLINVRCKRSVEENEGQVVRGEEQLQPESAALLCCEADLPNDEKDAPAIPLSLVRELVYCQGQGE